MLDYNGHTYVKPYAGHLNVLNQKQRNLQLSTASVSSNRSQSNYTTSKYSFKSGGIKNIYTKKYNKQQTSYFQNNCAKLTSCYLESPKPIISTHNNHFIHQNGEMQSRSKSLNSTPEYFRPITDPPQNIYTNFLQNTKMQDDSHWSPNFLLQRKHQLQNNNTALKKSISERKIKFQRQYFDLNTKVKFLKVEYQKQEQKMSRITAVVNEYFA